ncbi:hypothetical protein [Mycobacterium interjectum]|uniref:hypothetical protein n=1 Tax=Mycobacterium interjectum TaxID=33895 RepID=UPI0011559B10|nr:hypothetical protein [Mycobacterium interjectum]MCV7088878.1 hypothetical protein [Mycobacterium interjectum]
MAKQTCPRCGMESKRDAWWDRHPVAAVSAGLYTLTFMAMMLSVYPVAAAVMIVVAAAAGVLYGAARERRRRAAIAARADWEHRELMAKAVFRAQLPQPRRRTRPRGVDHWSRTEPIIALDSGSMVGPGSTPRKTA